MAREFGFAIIGCGLIADFHARAISELPGAKLVVVADKFEEPARRLARKFGCDWTCDWRDLLKRDDVRVVNVTTPSGTHADFAVAAARAKKHVICEKPLDITLPRVDRMIRAARENGVKLAGIFGSRFSEAAKTVKKAVDQGRFGRLTMGNAYVKWWRSQEYYDKGGWKGTAKLDGGGALMNQSIHAIDLLLWLMGPVRTVAAFKANLAHERIEVEDTAVASVYFANGALGGVFGATSAWPGFLKRIEISGDRGSAIFEEEDILFWDFLDKRPEDELVREKFAHGRSGAGGAADPAAISHEPHKRQIADFLEALRTGREPFVNGPEARKAVELILAIYRSAQKGRFVKLQG